MSRRPRARCWLKRRRRAPTHAAFRGGPVGREHTPQAVRVACGTLRRRAPFGRARTFSGATSASYRTPTPTATTARPRRRFWTGSPSPPPGSTPWRYREGEPDAAAAEYADTLQDVLRGDPSTSPFGVGDDAHTASLFPGNRGGLRRGPDDVVRPSGKETRLSLTAGQLSQSRTVAFLVQGEGKRAALEATLSPTETPDFSRTPSAGHPRPRRPALADDVAL
jgi:hypothetical protein